MSATNSAGMSDEVQAALNDDGEPDYGPQPDPIPARPADGAKVDKWRAYCVALGMHPDSAAEAKREDLISLADRFGG
jgi:hypothetical protein